jgi:hypothetical protein
MGIDIQPVPRNLGLRPYRVKFFKKVSAIRKDEFENSYSRGRLTDWRLARGIDGGAFTRRHFSSSCLRSALSTVRRILFL